MSYEEFAHQLREDYLAAKLEGARKPRPHTTNHPHSAGHPCDRYLVLLRVAWRLQVPLDDPVKAALFDEGRHQEHALVQDLKALPGYNLYMQHVPMHLPDLEVTGEIDFFLGKANERLYVTDAKSVSPGIFQALASAEDLEKHRRHFVRQWGDQVRLYLAAARTDPLLSDLAYPDAGLLILKDKTTGVIKPLVIPWDPDWWTWMQGRLGCLNQTVARIHETIAREVQPDWPDQVGALREALPSPLADPSVCPTCPYWHFCVAEIAFPHVDQTLVLDHPDLEGFLEAREQQKTAHQEYDAADAEARAILKTFKVTPGPRDRSYIVCGGFLVTITEHKPRGRSPYKSFDIWKRPGDLPGT